MPRKCCVPGCNSNYSSQSGSTYTPVFSFPKDDERWKKWNLAINRKDFLPAPSSVICIKHFDERFIIREDTFTTKDGTVITVPRKKCMLKDDAFPSIFPNQPHYLSKTLPKERKEPSERRKELIKRDEEGFLKWCELDNIKSFSDVKSAINDKLSGIWTCKIQENSIFLYKVEFINIPIVTVVLEILPNLSVNLYYKNEQLNSDNILGFVLGNEKRLDKWTKFDCIVSFLNTFNPKDLSNDVKIKNVTLLLSDIEENSGGDESKKIKFLSQQLSLIFSKQHRYDPEMILWSAKLYLTYPAAYLMIRESGVLTLPHQSYLRNLTGTLSLNPGNDFANNHYNYLKRKASMIQEHEKIVALLLDEIYINPSMDYKGGNVVGIADNCIESVTASTVQTFMLSSIFSKNKDVAALVPVKNITSAELHTYTKKVMDMLHSCDYTILCLISDNNRINRNMFTAMCNGHLTPFIQNPYDETKKLFFLFDTPHLIKSIRNNWMNQKATNQTFFYPDPVDVEKISIASLYHLKQIYDAEKNLVIRSAPKLTRKVLFPSSIERQNVKHALCLFHETNIVSLEQNSSRFGDDFLKTKHFLEYIHKWWKIVNCKHPKKGKKLRDELYEPITSIEHSNILFLEKFHAWITKWEELSNLPAADKTAMSLPEKGGSLSKETEFALKHTTQTLIHICKYVLENLKGNYVLLGKFQTDCLEARFGQFRQMNGGNYNISFRQIIESDKKLKLLSLIHLKSKHIGEFTIKSFDCSDEDVMLSTENYDIFIDVVNLCDSVHIPVETASVLIFISGYVAFKIKNKTACTECISTLSGDELLECDSLSDEYFKYMLLTNRGGLTWPKHFTYIIILTAFKIFHVLISEQYEYQFLKHANLKDIVQKLTMEKIIISNSISVSMCSCGVSSDSLAKKCISIIANILINNYCKAKNDKLLANKCSKRKLSTLLASTSKA